MNIDTQMLLTHANFSVGCFVISLILIGLDIIILKLKVGPKSLFGLDYTQQGYLVTALLWAIGAALLGVLVNIFKILDLEHSYEECVFFIAAAWPFMLSRLIKRAQTASEAVVGASNTSDT